MGEARFDGSILAELERLAATGTVRVLDAMVLLMEADGSVVGLDIEDMPAQDAAALGFIDTGTRGLFDAADSAALAEGMVPGSAIIALAIENAWAVPLMNAVVEAGAELALYTRVPAPMVEDAMARVVAAQE